MSGIRNICVFILAITFLSGCEDSPTAPLSAALPEPPQCAFVGLSDGQRVDRGFIRIEATASDSDGDIQSVKFSIDGRDRFTAVDSPYVYTWNCGGEWGNAHGFRITATDTDGKTASQEITVNLRYVYQSPEHLDEDWEVSTLARENLDTVLIAMMMDKIYGEPHRFMHGVLIFRNDKLVLEEYFNNYQYASLNILQSTTKSITSALIGTMFDRGYLTHLDQPVFDFFPEFDHLSDSLKQKITLEHVLTMTPGLSWNEGSVPTISDSNDNMIGNRSGNYIRYALNKEVVYPPGTNWYYNSGCTMMLGGIIKNVTGMMPDAYAVENLFTPLGIRYYHWSKEYVTQMPWVHGGLALRARDMAKIGSMYMHGGLWKGQRVLSEEWIQASIRPFIDVNSLTGYGYQWWMKEKKYYTSGYGGQHIVCVPERNLIVITTADFSDHENMGAQRIAINHLIDVYMIGAAL